MSTRKAVKRSLAGLIIVAFVALTAGCQPGGDTIYMDHISGDGTQDIIIKSDAFKVVEAYFACDGNTGGPGFQGDKACLAYYFEHSAFMTSTIAMTNATNLYLKPLVAKRIDVLASGLWSALTTNVESNRCLGAFWLDFIDNGADWRFNTTISEAVPCPAYGHLWS